MTQPAILAQAAPFDPTLWFLAALLLFMYFLIWRPQRKQQKEQADLLSSLAVGDEVSTVSGMVGTLVTVKEHYVSVDVGAGKPIFMVKSAVSRMLPKGTVKSITSEPAKNQKKGTQNNKGKSQAKGQNKSKDQDTTKESKDESNSSKSGKSDESGTETGS